MIYATVKMSHRPTLSAHRRGVHISASELATTEHTIGRIRMLHRGSISVMERVICKV